MIEPGELSNTEDNIESNDYLLDCTELKNVIKSDYMSHTNSGHNMTEADDFAVTNTVSYEWLSNSNVCRCCVSSTGTWDLTSSYVSPVGEREVFLELLEECFGITLSNIAEWGPSRSVCDRCATSLRHAHIFKRQVLQAESDFVKYLARNGEITDVKEDNVDGAEVENEDYADALQTSVVFSEDKETRSCDGYPSKVKTEEDNESGNILNISSTEETIVENENSNSKPVDSEMAIRPKATRKRIRKISSNDAKKSETVKKKTEGRKSNTVKKRFRKVMVETIDSESDVEIERYVHPPEPQYSEDFLKEVSEKMRLNVTCETVLRYTTACPFRHYKSRSPYIYKCFYCPELFEDMKTVKGHTQTHSPAELYKKKHFTVLHIEVTGLKCKLCDSFLVDVEDMIRHMSEVHDKIAYREYLDGSNVNDAKILDSSVMENVKLYEKSNLETCGTETSPKVSDRKRLRLTCLAVLTHTTACPFRHHRSWFQCFYCREDFMEMDLLKLHTREHTNNELATLKTYPRTLQIDITELHCNICKTTLEDVGVLVEHFSEAHAMILYKECIAGYKVNKSPYKCHLCAADFHVFRTLTMHLNEHYANVICDECGKSFMNTKRLQVHKRTHEIGVFPCSRCDKVLETKSAKVNHMESHAKRVIRCHICFQTMKHYNDRVKHMSEKHNITNHFKCLKCPKEFKVKHYLATHVRQTHGRKNKKCAECGMVFRTAHVLKKHMWKHTGVKFSCDFCNKSYVRKYTLREHIIKAHENG